LDDLVKKDRVWVWSRDLPVRGPAGRTVNKAEIECFAILEYHDAPTNVENSTLELVDIHLLDPEEGLSFARALIDGLCDHYLRHTEKRQPYRLFFVNVDSVIPESSDEFLLDCGFTFDSAVTMVSMAKPKPLQPHQQPGVGLSDAVPKVGSALSHYTLVDTVTVASSTEKPFTAYTVRDNFTGDTALKRYREFDTLYGRLKVALPKANLPKPPKKKLFGNLESDFVERRRKKLDQWMNAIAECPGVADTALIDDFMVVQLKRRGVKQTEEAHLVEILKRTSDKPVQIVDKPSDQIILQRVASQASSNSHAESSTEGSDSVSSAHQTKSVPSLLQVTDSIVGVKKGSSQTMPNLNAAAAIGPSLTSPRSIEKSPRKDKSPRSPRADSDAVSPRRSKPPKSLSEAPKSSSTPKEAPSGSSEKKSSSSSRSHRSNRSATLKDGTVSTSSSSSHRSRHHHHRDREDDKKEPSSSSRGINARPRQPSVSLRQSRESPI
jgi:hypothetical protein